MKVQCSRSLRPLLNGTVKKLRPTLSCLMLFTVTAKKMLVKGLKLGRYHNSLYLIEQSLFYIRKTWSINIYLYKCGDYTYKLFFWLLFVVPTIITIMSAVIFRIGLGVNMLDIVFSYPISSIVSTYGVLAFSYSIFSRKLGIRSFYPRKYNYKFKTRKAEGIFVNEISAGGSKECLVSWDKILPSIKEESVGFTSHNARNDALICAKNGETDTKTPTNVENFITSENINNALLNQSSIKFKIDDCSDLSFTAISKSKSRNTHDDQLKLRQNFLALRSEEVAQLFNQNKVSLSFAVPNVEQTDKPDEKKSIEFLNSAVIRKSTYLDDLCSRVFYCHVIESEDPKLIVSVEKSTETIRCSQYYPHEKSGDSKYRLKSFSEDFDPLQLGVTAVGLTSDNCVVLLSTANNIATGAGQVTVAASGSADWEDIQRSHEVFDSHPTGGTKDLATSQVGDLVGLVKTGMLRELFEENGLNLGHGKLNEFIRLHATNTLVTGFFRWVENGGKPEFVGVVKLNKTSNEMEIDDEEITHSHSIKISNIDDFPRVFEEVRKQGRNMGLSNVFAVRRLIEIASYEKSDDSAKREIFGKVNNLLFPNKSMDVAI
jgi:hypothetical protein